MLVNIEQYIANVGGKPTNRSGGGRRRRRTGSTLLSPSLSRARMKTDGRTKFLY